MTPNITNLVDVWKARPRINITGDTGWDDFFAEPENASWAARLIIAAGPAMRDLDVTNPTPATPDSADKIPNSGNLPAPLPAPGNSTRIPGPSQSTAGSAEANRQKSGTGSKSSTASERRKPAHAVKDKRAQALKESADSLRDVAPPPPAAAATDGNASA